MKSLALVLCLSLSLSGCGKGTEGPGDSAPGGGGGAATGGGGGGGGRPAGLSPVQNPVASCNAAASGVCTDYAGSASHLRLGCSAAGTWSETTFCSPARSCGSCTVDAGSFQATTYYFPSSGAERDSASVCANGQGTWADDPGITCT